VAFGVGVCVWNTGWGGVSERVVGDASSSWEGLVKSRTGLFGPRARTTHLEHLVKVLLVAVRVFLHPRNLVLQLDALVFELGDFRLELAWPRAIGANLVDDFVHFFKLALQVLEARHQVDDERLALKLGRYLYG